MTDRNVGGEGLRVDVTAGQATVGGEGLNVDVVPASIERRTDGLYVQADIQVPPLAVSGYGLRLDVAVAGLRLGTIGVLIDYVPSSVLVDAVTWAGPAFNIGGVFPDVHWASGKFQYGSGPRVLWQDDHFELEI